MGWRHVSAFLRTSLQFKQSRPSTPERLLSQQNCALHQGGVFPGPRKLFKTTRHLLGYTQHQLVTDLRLRRVNRVRRQYQKAWRRRICRGPKNRRIGLHGLNHAAVLIQINQIERRIGVRRRESMERNHPKPLARLQRTRRHSLPRSSPRRIRPRQPRALESTPWSGCMRNGPAIPSPLLLFPAPSPPCLHPCAAPASRSCLSCCIRVLHSSSTHLAQLGTLHRRPHQAVPLDICRIAGFGPRPAGNSIVRLRSPVGRRGPIYFTNLGLLDVCAAALDQNYQHNHKQHARNYPDNRSCVHSGLPSSTQILHVLPKPCEDGSRQPALRQLTLSRLRCSGVGQRQPPSWRGAAGFNTRSR